MNIEIINKFSIRENTKYVKEKPGKILLTSDYTLVDPINISSPSDWGLYSSFITGNGSDLDPYIIENIEIQGKGVKTIEEYGHTHLNYSDFGIYINAEGYFIIRNCKISSISIGILLLFGVSADYIHHIERVEISNCGMGIYSNWHNIALNISKCEISNCHWVTVKAPFNFDSTPIQYGGYGIWVSGAFNSTIEFCRIQNCSIGLVATPLVDLISNKLINCGLSFDFSYGVSNYRFNNTVNGKPIGLFYGEDNLIISGQEASQYGQLIFIFCSELQLSNFHITEPCSIGVIIYLCDNPVLKNIVCENQKIGFFFLHTEITADNLYAKNCDAGFYLSEIYDSTLTQLLTDNTDIPIYSYTPIHDSTIEIEKSTRFYIIDNLIICDELHVNSSVSSFSVFESFLTEFDNKGFLIQLNDTQTYQITDTLPTIWVNFTIVIFQESQPSAIPGFPLFWFYMAIISGILSLSVHLRWKKR